MSKFNQGRPYHGGEDFQGGRLTGATDTDYFYFFCPRCPDHHILRVLEYDVARENPGNRYDHQSSSNAGKTFTIAFKLHCENCGLTDFVKVSNGGWQHGRHADALGRLGQAT